jgi:hypothetical protein
MVPAAACATWLVARLRQNCETASVGMLNIGLVPLKRGAGVYVTAPRA